MVFQQLPLYVSMDTGFLPLGPGLLASPTRLTGKGGAISHFPPGLRRRTIRRTALEELRQAAPFLFLDCLFLAPPTLLAASTALLRRPPLLPPPLPGLQQLAIIAAKPLVKMYAA